MKELKLDEPHAKRWTFMVDNINVEIILWGEGCEHHNEGRGIFNYYLYIPEKHFKNVFEELWIEDKIYKITESSPERISHDYYNIEAIDYMDLHGGCTFYQKLGHTAGHRTIKVGCDYNHLWDMESLPEFYTVVSDAKRSAELFNQYVKTKT
jgi:hypothetical protein